MSGFLGADLGSLALGPGLGALIGNPGNYSTRPVATLPPALYSLAIRSGQMPFFPYFIYTFPLSPSSLRKESAGMANFYDVAGNPATFGVQRLADVYGLAPPIYSIAGTTGVKRHSTDRFLATGLESILILQAAIAQYFSVTAAAGQSGDDPPRLEFYDYFASDFWQVVPIGPQGIMQDASRPQLVNYQFRLVAIQSLLTPLVEDVDSLLSGFGGSIGGGINGMDGSLDSATSSYSAFSPAGA